MLLHDCLNDIWLHLSILNPGSLWTYTYDLIEEIELFNYGERKQRSSDDESRVGYRHIALETDDVEAWEHHLRENNIKIISKNGS